MGKTVQAWRRGLLAVLLLLNLFAPIQKVLACVSLADQAMPMDMGCCPEAVALGDDRYAAIERQILAGHSCCTVAIEERAQTPSIHHQHYAQSALQQVLDAPWQLLPIVLSLSPVPEPEPFDAGPPGEQAAALGGTRTYAHTARLRL